MIFLVFSVSILPSDSLGAKISFIFFAPSSQKYPSGRKFLCSLILGPLYSSIWSFSCSAGFISWLCKNLLFSSWYDLVIFTESSYGFIYVSKALPDSSVKAVFCAFPLSSKLAGSVLVFAYIPLLSIGAINIRATVTKAILKYINISLFSIVLLFLFLFVINYLLS